jgi:malonyl-CoA O-methyltransferase
VKNSDYQPDKQIVTRNFNASAATYNDVAVLQQTVAEQIAERLNLFKIEPRMILDLGSGTGFGSRLLKKCYRHSTIIQTDLACNMLKRARQSFPGFFRQPRYVCGDAESLPFQDGAFDLVFSSLMLQWCNNFDQVFAEAKRILKPGGLFIFSSFGPDTLQELRESWQQVDSLVHVNAFTDMHDVGDALLRNGFAGPVMEDEYYTMTYRDVATLMHELKQLGAQNVNAGRRHSMTGKGRLARMIREYEKWRMDGRLPATFEVIYGHAWKRVRGTSEHETMTTASIPVTAITRRK